jgi:hypothetical protein
MLHIQIIAIGFAAIAAIGLYSFMKTKGPNRTVCEVLTLTSFGVGFLGLLSLIALYKPLEEAKTITWIGACWLSILNGLFSCIFSMRFDRILKEMEKG